MGTVDIEMIRTEIPYSDTPNAPWKFWRMLDDRIQPEHWLEAARASFGNLEGIPAQPTENPLQDIEDILSERQFGPDHWQLPLDKQIYYFAARRFMNAGMRKLLHRFVGRKHHDDMKFPLRWTVESRYAAFQWEMVRLAMENAGVSESPYIHFWPHAKRYAVVLTHDIEEKEGMRFALKVADLEERLGFRSAFNIVPETYKVDTGVVQELVDRGFEIGVHGLKHDGRLFSSYKQFASNAQRINGYLEQWGAVGFRSPFTHRNPDWMQLLNIEYDCSFFDTDPFETISGGTMSLWPFVMGRFIEMPYTLPQDCTLRFKLNETTPVRWIEKLKFVSSYYGMAQTLTHPDYLREQVCWNMYEELLEHLSATNNYWCALPRDVARWWRARMNARCVPSVSGKGLCVPDLPEATIGTILYGDDHAESISLRRADTVHYV